MTLREYLKSEAYRACVQRTIDTGVAAPTTEEALVLAKRRNAVRCRGKSLLTDMLKAMLDDRAAVAAARIRAQGAVGRKARRASKGGDA